MNIIKFLLAIAIVVFLIGISNYVPSPEKIIITSNGVAKEIMKSDRNYNLIVKTVRKSVYFSGPNLGTLKIAAPSEPHMGDGIEFVYSRPIVLGTSVLINKFFINSKSIMFGYKNGQYVNGGKKLGNGTNIYNKITQY